MRKDILTTGDVARICSVSRLIVVSWFDKGLLEGFKIPGSGQRRSGHIRILVRDLIEFLKNNKIPYDKAALRKFQLEDSR